MSKQNISDCIEIIPCDPFLQDTIFENSRKALEEKGLVLKEELKKIPKDPEKIVSNLMANTTLDNVLYTNDKFEILIDVRGYRAEELKCKIVANSVEVTAQREETSGYMARKMSLTRSYQLPQSASYEQAKCFLSSDGMLLITAPWSNS